MLLCRRDVRLWRKLESESNSWKEREREREREREVVICDLFQTLFRVVIAAGDFNCSREAIDSAKILDDPVIT